MELRHLRYFVALAEELHFGRAAARLHISQPPLSQQIAGLERELDARLFERTKRRVELTAAGRLFLPEARATLEQAERARLVAARAQRGELGELRMGMFPSAPLSNAVSGAISAFRRSAPDVRLVLREMLTPQQVAELESGELDVGFLRSHIRPALPPGLAATEVVREPLCVMMPADHPLAAGAGPLPLAALEGEAIVFLARSVGSALNDQLHALCAAAGFAPRITQETSANAMIVGLVAAGLGLSVQPATLCRISSDRIRVRRLDAPGAVTASWLAHREGDASPLVRRFVTHFRRGAVQTEEPPRDVGSQTPWSRP